MKSNPDGSVTLTREEYRKKREELNRALKRVSELEQILELTSEKIEEEKGE